MTMPTHPLTAALRLSEEMCAAFRVAFPGIDLMGEILKMEAWLAANPRRRPRNHARFAYNWLRKLPAPRRATKYVCAVCNTDFEGPMALRDHWCELRLKV